MGFGNTEVTSDLGKSYLDGQKSMGGGEAGTSRFHKPLGEFRVKGSPENW